LYYPPPAGENGQRIAELSPSLRGHGEEINDSSNRIGIFDGQKTRNMNLKIHPLYPPPAGENAWKANPRYGRKRVEDYRTIPLSEGAGGGNK